MKDQDHDWLDDRLAAGDYIPDGGFTAKILTQLPKNSAVKVEAQRRRILASAFVLAFVVAICMTIAEAGKWAISFSRLLSGIFQEGNVAHATDLIQQPGVILSVGLAMAVITFAALPLLRRWA